MSRALTVVILVCSSAGCVPFCTSIIADYFGAANRGAALGFFNWGVFVGYSLAFLLIMADQQFGWRAVFLISGLPGASRATHLQHTIPCLAHRRLFDQQCVSALQWNEWMEYIEYYNACVSCRNLVGHRSWYNREGARTAK